MEMAGARNIGSILTFYRGENEAKKRSLDQAQAGGNSKFSYFPSFKLSFQTSSHELTFNAYTISLLKPYLLGSSPWFALVILAFFHSYIHCVLLCARQCSKK